MHLLEIIYISIGLVVALLIILKWKSAIYVYIAFITVSGAITLLMSPSIIALLGKDIFILLPAYFSYLIHTYRFHQNKPPYFFNALVLFLICLVILQCFNYNIPNILVSLIGLKVWLFYIPIAYLIYSMINNNDEFIRLLRFILIVSWLPCLIGIMQWIGSTIYGYENFITSFYGDAAYGATQGFTQMGGLGTFYRIPSTFTYVGQYFGFILCMLVPASILMSIDPSNLWKRFANLSFILLILSSFMSGARAAFVFVPLFLLILFFLSGSLLRFTKFLILFPILFIIGLPIIGISPINMLGVLTELMFDYGNTIVIKGILDALGDAPFGLGTGMNTGPSRYAFDDPSTFSAFENYYAKSIYELGFLGLILIILLFIYPIFLYLKYRSFINKFNKIIIVSFLSFFIVILINSLKGWQIDLDPVNFYYWLYYGLFLSRLKSLELMSAKNKNLNKNIADAHLS